MSVAMEVCMHSLIRSVFSSAQIDMVDRGYQIGVVMATTTFIALIVVGAIP